MRILSIDSSAMAASAAILEDDVLLGEFFVNTRQTHSQTLLPMVEKLLQSTGKTCRDMDVMAVSAGPGSFTGVRIGVSCVKGLAFANDICCCGVSTLEAIAFNAAGMENKLICAVMDARCGQVYNGLFRWEKGSLHRLCEDRAVAISELYEECKAYKDSLLLAGDGAALCLESFQDFGAQILPEARRFQRASSVALAAKLRVEHGEGVPPEQLVPFYLRLPQAERELKKKQQNI